MHSSIIRPAKPWWDNARSWQLTLVGLRLLATHTMLRLWPKTL